MYDMTSGIRYQDVGAVDVTGGDVPVQKRGFNFDDMSTTGTFLAQTTSLDTMTGGATFSVVITRR